MDTLSQVIERVETYVKRSGLSETTVSRKVFKDGKRLKRLRETGSCTIGLLARANERLDDLEASLEGSEAA